MGLTRELLTRVGAITLIYALVSLLVIQRHMSTPSKFLLDVPLLFVTCGIVLTISVVYCLRKYGVMNVK